jgi:hypothetical protein
MNVKAFYDFPASIASDNTAASNHYLSNMQEKHDTIKGLSSSQITRAVKAD